jgi:hypothetical protein
MFRHTTKTAVCADNVCNEVWADSSRMTRDPELIRTKHEASDSTPSLVDEITP